MQVEVFSASGLLEGFFCLREFVQSQALGLRIPAFVALDGKRMTPSQAESLSGCGHSRNWRCILKTQLRDVQMSMDEYLARLMMALVLGTGSTWAHLEEAMVNAILEQAPSQVQGGGGGAAGPSAGERALACEQAA